MTLERTRVRRRALPLALLFWLLAPLACRAQSDVAEVAEDDRFARSFIRTLRCEGLEGVRADLDSALARSPDLAVRFLEARQGFPSGDSVSVETVQISVARLPDQLEVESIHTVRTEVGAAMVEMVMTRAGGRRYVRSVSVQSEADGDAVVPRLGEPVPPAAEWRPPVCR